MLVLIDAVTARRGIGLGELLLRLGAVDALLEHGFLLVDLELVLEVLQVARIATAAVGSAAGIVEIEFSIVTDFVADTTPEDELLAPAMADYVGRQRVERMTVRQGR